LNAEALNVSVIYRPPAITVAVTEKSETELTMINKQLSNSG